MEHAWGIKCGKMKTPMEVWHDEEHLKKGLNKILTGTFFKQKSAHTITDSDIRFKTNVRPINKALSTVCALSGKIYSKDDKDNQIGLIAQDVEKILPQMVHTASDEIGTKSVNYQNMVAILIEAIKEQNERINKLTEMLESK